MKPRHTTAFCFLLASLQAPAFTLDEAWEAAAAHSPEQHAAEYGRDAELEKEQQAKAALLPQISASAQYRRNHMNDGRRHNASWNVQLSQSLYDPVKTARYRQSQINSKAAQARVDYNRDELMIDVSENYFSVLLAQENIKALAAEKEAYRKQIVQAEQLFAHGAATAVDVYEAKAGYDGALAKEIQAVAEKQLAQNRLADATGLNPEEIGAVDTVALDERLRPQIERHSLEEWQQRALQANSAYRSYKLGTDSAAAAVQTAKSAKRPKVQASLSYGGSRNFFGRDDGSRAHVRGWTAEVGISMPLYNGGESNSVIRESAARFGEAQANLLAVERKVRLAVRQAYTQSRAARYQMLAQERVLASSRLKLKATETGKQYGIRNTLEVIRARQETAEAEQKLAQARYRYLHAYLTLAKESGWDVREAWRLAAVHPSVHKPAVVPQRRKRKKS